MDNQTFSGYVIINTITVEDKKIVLGKNQSETYVTWEWSDNKGYSDGHFFDDILFAVRDFLERSKRELDYAIRKREDFRRHSDIDADGIPDFIDGEYTGVEEKYRYVRMNREQFNKLKQSDILFEATLNGDYTIVRYTQNYQKDIEQLVNRRTKGVS